MDGVTDAPFRQIVSEVGRPDVLYTEFVNVEGLARGAVNMLRHFDFVATERPIIAQLYGTEVASFRTAAQIVAALGFDGVDINMGCPAKKVAHRGAGAGLIKSPELAAEIITAVKQGVADWAEGLEPKDIQTTGKLRRALAERVKKDATRRLIPVSVKTRLGYDQSIAVEWASFLARQDLYAITIHGRTLKQAYTGSADWSELAKGFAAIKKINSHTLVIGNGDVATRADGIEKCRQYGCDGVLIGRAALGNPWVFIDYEPTVAERIDLAVRHAVLFEELMGSAAFPAFRRHLAAYIKGLPNAASLRNQLMQTNSAAQVRELLRQG
jgi:nifR3 family TIM-barrel protein